MNINLKLTEEQAVILAGILYYSEGEVLTDVFDEIMNELTPSQQTKVANVSREIAIKGNGYYIDEDDLLYTIFRK